MNRKIVIIGKKDDKKKIKSILSNFQFLSLCIVSYYQSKFFVKIQSLNTNSKFLKLIIKQKNGLTCLMPLFLNSTQRHAQPTVNKDQNFCSWTTKITFKQREQLRVSQDCPEQNQQAGFQCLPVVTAMQLVQHSRSCVNF